MTPKHRNTGRTYLGIALLLLTRAPHATPLLETTCVFPATPDSTPNYCTPSILQALNGDLLVFAEKRNDGIGNVGKHDLVLKRSRDKGKTWSTEQLIFDDGESTSTEIQFVRFNLEWATGGQHPQEESAN